MAKEIIIPNREEALKENFKREDAFFKRASNGYLLKLYRAYSKENYVYSWDGQPYIGKVSLTKEIYLYDAHWTNSLIKKGEEPTKSEKKYITTTLERLKNELDSRPHVMRKKEGKKRRQELAKKGK